MREVLIAGGTTEGRLLAEFCRTHGIAAAVFVATEYGARLLAPSGTLRVVVGRKNADQFAAEMKAHPYHCVIDATHPYARLATSQLREAADRSCLPYVRLEREREEETQDCVWVDSLAEAADYLGRRKGGALVTTGSKDLGPFSAFTDKSRLWIRVLPTAEAIAACAEAGFLPSRILAMQGPFSKELNAALLRQYQCGYMVTKDSGRAGGFFEKLAACRESGAVLIAIRRPREERGMNLRDTESWLLSLRQKEPQEGTDRELGETRAALPHIDIVGVGMGSPELMTRETEQAIEAADAYAGSGRALKLARAFGRPCLDAYDPGRIADWIGEHPEYGRIAVLMSGDPGFYSGAKKLWRVLCERGWTAEIKPGISSLSYLASRLGISWEDMKICSLHKRAGSLAGQVAGHYRVFALLGSPGGLAGTCGDLVRRGMDQVRVYVGENLSYPEERLWRGTASEALEESFAPLSAVIFENDGWREPPLFLGIPQEQWIRGKTPMTKAEIRAVAIGKLGLTRSSVVYDVGSGTGSVAVEAAMVADEGQVYAFERSPEALDLIRANCTKFGVDNVTVVEGEAPESFEGRPIPTHACIGGSGGRLREIIGRLLDRNPKIRIVVLAVTLETMGRLAQLDGELAEIGRRDFCYSMDLVQMQANRIRKAGDYHLMQAENPVLIATLSGERRKPAGSPDGPAGKEREEEL